MGLDWEDSAGVSAPLYDIVDVVFELGSRGFFRRQVLDTRCFLHMTSECGTALHQGAYAALVRPAKTGVEWSLRASRQRAMSVSISRHCASLQVPTSSAVSASHHSDNFCLSPQIFSVGRQVLSLIAGGAIDVFLLGQLRLLRQEHTLARAIHAIQASLWPGGTWFMYRPERRKPPVSTSCSLYFRCIRVCHTHRCTFLHSCHLTHQWCSMAAPVHKKHNTRQLQERQARTSDRHL